MWENDSPKPSTPTRGTFPGVSNQQAAEGRNGDRSFIGSSITIKGELSGTQDVLIEGRIEGELSLTGCNITVGKEGRLKADLLAKVIHVDGLVEGLLRGEEQILLSETGRVRGKLIAPQVVLEEGCSFKGTVDMGDRTKDSAFEPKVQPFGQSPDREILPGPAHFRDLWFPPLIFAPVSFLVSVGPVW